MGRFVVALTILGLVAVVYAVYADYTYNSWLQVFYRSFRANGANVRVLDRRCYLFWASFLIDIREQDLNRCVESTRLTEITESRDPYGLKRVRDRLNERGNADFSLDAQTVRMFKSGGSGPKDFVAYDRLTHHAVVYMDGTMN